MIARVWIGPELEGFDKGTQTMFVAADHKIESSFVFDMLHRWNIKRVYLGAGRLNFNGLDNNQSFVDKCVDEGVEIVVEVNIFDLNDNIRELIDREEVKVIYTVRNPRTKFPVERQNTYLKYDNYEDVYMFDMNNASKTSLSDLRGMTFDQDTIIYDYHD